MSQSVRLTFAEPEAPPPGAKPVNPAAMTRDERASANWQVRFIAWVVGLPSLMSIAFVGAAGLWYAWNFTADAQTWLALSAGLVAVTLFGAGLPIAWALMRDNNPMAAKAAFVFWIACVLMNFAIMAHFVRRTPAPAGPGRLVARDLPDREAYELDLEINWRREALADADEHPLTTPEARRWYAATQADLWRFETKRYGKPVTLAAAPGPLPGLDLAAIALLMLGGSAVGLLISAGSLAAILTEKAATVRMEAETAPQHAPAPGAAYHPGESADGFEHWAASCVSRLEGGRIRPAEAHASYLAFCARNDYAAPLAIQEFGRRLRVWLADTYGLNGHHSNGTVYEGVTVAPLAPSITAPAMNGAAI